MPTKPSVKDEGEEDQPDVIFSYTSEDAVADGAKIKLYPFLWCTTNLARRLAPSDDDATGYDHDLLMTRVIQPLFKRWSEGVYFDEGATDHPEETEQDFACYKVGDERVWLIRDGEGMHFILPEDY